MTLGTDMTLGTHCVSPVGSCVSPAGSLDSSYEIPLVSLSATGIRDHTRQRPLPKWVGVKHVIPEINERFQRLAIDIANEKQTLRVHLDAMFWGGR